MNKLNQNEMIMNASNWNKVMIFLSVISVIVIIEVSIVVLLLVSGRIDWPEKVDPNVFWGTFISTCTTFIVGFQIWNYISASDKLKELEEMKNILTQEIQELKEAKFESQYYNAYTIGCMRYQTAKGYHYEEEDQRNYLNALRAFTKALLYAKAGGHDFERSYNAISRKVFDAIDSIPKIKDKMISYFVNPSECYSMMETINDNMHEIQMYIKEKYTCSYNYNKFPEYMKKWENIYTSILQNKDGQKGLYRYCPWIVLANLLAKFRRATVHCSK